MEPTPTETATPHQPPRSIFDQYTQNPHTLFFLKTLFAGTGAAVPSITLLPFLMTAGFSMKQGVPLFELTHAFEPFWLRFFGLSLVFTTFVIAYFMLPGFFRIGDPLKLETLERLHKKTNVANRDSREAEYRNSRTRFCLLPGMTWVVFIMAAFSIGADNAESIDQLDKSVIAAAVLMPALALFGCAFAYRSQKTLRAKLFVLPADGKKKAKSNAGFWFSIAFFDFVFVSLYAYITLILFAGMPDFWKSLAEDETTRNHLQAFSLSATVSSLLIFSVMWATKISFKSAAITWFGMLLFLVLAIPGATKLMNGHLRTFAQGGGIKVVLTTDENLPREIPQIFHVCAGPDGEKYFTRQTQILSLTFLGVDKAFLRLPQDSMSVNRFDNVQFELDRSRITSMTFLSDAIDDIEKTVPTNPPDGKPSLEEKRDATSDDIVCAANALLTGRSGARTKPVEDMVPSTDVQ